MIHLIRRLFKKLTSSGKSNTVHSTPNLKETEKTLHLPRLTLQNKEYEIAYTEEVFCTNVVERNRCFVKIGYPDIIPVWKEAQHELVNAGKDPVQGFNYEKHIQVFCTKCQAMIRKEALGKLYLSQSTGMDGNFNVSFSGNFARTIADCPACHNPHCYIVFDPDGLQMPSREFAEYLCYSKLKIAEQQFELFKNRLVREKAKLSLHGQIELRTDILAEKEHLPYMHWLVIHGSSPDPNKFLSTLMKDLDLVSDDLKYEDHDFLSSKNRIEENEKRSKLHEKVVF